MTETVEHVEGALSTRTYRQTMSRFPKSCTVITTAGADGPVGCTATSIFSLSLRPPSLVVSLGSTSTTLVNVLSSGRFMVNMLSSSQYELSTRFATGDPSRRLDGVPHTWWGDVPVLADTSASLACDLVQVVSVYDHTLVVGAVQWTRTDEHTPLVLLDGQAHVARPRLAAWRDTTEESGDQV